MILRPSTIHVQINSLFRRHSKKTLTEAPCRTGQELRSKVTPRGPRDTQGTQEMNLHQKTVAPHWQYGTTNRLYI